MSGGVVQLALLSRFQIRIVGPNSERVERLHKLELVIGRLAQADIVVASAEVSRRHVTLRVEGEQLFIIDEGSKNGTFLDGVRLPTSVPRPWLQGQSVKLGLAPEKLTLELATDSKDVQDAPPPVDTKSFTRGSIRHTKVTEQSGLLQKTNVSAVSSMTKSLNTQKFESKVINEKVEPKVSPPAAKTTGGPSLLGDLERRMQEVLARAEAEAKLLRQESQIAKQTGEHRPVREDAQADQLEKAKLESQLRELRTEIHTRSEERKVLARDHAEAKLNLQNIQQEIKRSESAKNQLNQTLSDEINVLEKKIEQLESQINAEADEHKQKAQKEAREIIELAKKQSELLISDAEIKAKNQRDKMQVKITDERLTTELDLADLKLQQVAELKAAQEKLENEWQKNQQKTVTSFLSDVREKCEKTVFNSQLDAGLKLRLLTTLEESLHHHFSVVIDKHPIVPRPIVKPAEVSSAPRFTLRSAAFAVGGLVIVLLSGAVWLQQRSQQRLQPSPVAVKPEVREIASAPVPVPLPVAPAPTPTVAPAPVAVPVPPPTPVPIVPEVKAAQEVALPPPVVPQSPVVTVPRNAPPATVTVTWAEIVSLKPAGHWQKMELKYLQTINVDRRKVKQYQMLEQRFARDVAKLGGRNPASLKEQQRLESQFTRDAFQLLGPSTWAKLMTYRDYFWNKSH